MTISRCLQPAQRPGSRAHDRQVIVLPNWRKAMFRFALAFAVSPKTMSQTLPPGLCCRPSDPTNVRDLPGWLTASVAHLSHEAYGPVAPWKIENLPEGPQARMVLGRPAEEASKPETVKPVFDSLIRKVVLFQWLEGREGILDTTRRQGRVTSYGDTDAFQLDVPASSSLIRRTAFGSLTPTHWAILPATPAVALRTAKRFPSCAITVSVRALRSRRMSAHSA